MIAWRDRVVRAFDAAADYDAHAAVQRDVSNWLAERIAETSPYARVLEIGCGTGFLAEAALAGSGARDWMMTDIAPAMVARARARFKACPDVRFGLVDGERPALGEEDRFDLVCSSLAAQWFADLPAALDRLAHHVAPGGALMVTTLAEGTFGSWRAAAGAAAGTPVYPNVGQFTALRADGLPAQVEMRSFEGAHRRGRDFLRSLKALGASTPRPGHRPVPAGSLRTALRTFEQAGGISRYEVALLTFRRENPQ